MQLAFWRNIFLLWTYFILCRGQNKNWQNVHLKLLIDPVRAVGINAIPGSDFPNITLTDVSAITELMKNGILFSYVTKYQEAETSNFLTTGNIKSGHFDTDNEHLCVNDTVKVGKDIGKQLYASQYLDAEAKIPAGILKLNWLWPGAFEECQSIESVLNPDTGKYFHGKYFLVAVYKNGQPFFAPFPLAVGICLPSSCSPDDAKTLFNAVVSPLEKITAGEVMDFEDEPYNTGAVVAFVVSGIILILVAMGTASDALQQYQKLEKDYPEVVVSNGISFNSKRSNLDEEPTERTSLLAQDEYKEIAKTKSVNNFTNKNYWRKLLQSFSVLTNGKKLVNTSTAHGPLACLNGLRVISMWWVIQGHTYGFSNLFLDNTAEAQAIVQRFSFQPIVNGTFSVDSFFFLSGLLVAYFALKQLKEKGKLSWPYFFLHRYWRLTPLYAFVIMIFTTMTIHMVSGPYTIFFKPNMPSPVSASLEACRTSWWANLIYINNFYPHYGNDGLTCAGWTWYLANDMQFYIFLSPIVIFLLHRKRLVGVIVTSFLTLSCIVIRLIMVVEYEMYGFQGPTMKHKDDPMVKNGPLYARPYARMAVYLIGMLVGDILCSTKCRLKLNKVLSLIGWCVATATALAVVYGQYYYNHLTDPVTSAQPLMTLPVSALYVSTTRAVWALCLGWLVLACASGYGGPVNSILSWKIWAPLGRLTYAAYLVHPIVIYVFYTNMTVPLHFTDLIMIYMFLGNLVISYGIAFLVSMAVEAPMMQLEKVILNR